MNKKDTKSSNKTPTATKITIKPEHELHINIFHELLKRQSILLTLFDTKTKEVINFCGNAPSPSKDYCQLIVNFDQVIYRWWKITHRNDADKYHPGEIKDTFEDFTYDEIIKHHILCAFGKNFLTYVENIISNAQLDYLARLPEAIIVKILSYLSLEDISKMSQVNNQFRELCRSDRLWILLYQKYYSRDITKELHSLAQKKGWRNIFFTNKIRLQVELRREANEENPVEDDRYSSVTDNSVRDLMKSVSTIGSNALIRRHSIGTSRKSIDTTSSSSIGYLSASVNKKDHKLHKIYQLKM